MAAPGGRARWGATLRSTWFKVTAAVTAAAALGAGAFLASGYDTAQTKVDDSSVWVLRTGGEEYARVNARLGEVDTVKGVPNPSGLVQADGHVLLYSQTNAQVASVDLAQPADYTTSGDDAAKDRLDEANDALAGYQRTLGTPAERDDRSAFATGAAVELCLRRIIDVARPFV